MAFKSRTGKAAGKKAAKGRIKKQAKDARKRAASKKRAKAEPAGPRGARVELRPTRRKQLAGNYMQEWRFTAISSNGQTMGGMEPGESVKHRKYAIKKADRQFPDLPIYIMPKGLLVADDDRPSRVKPGPTNDTTLPTEDETHFEGDGHDHDPEADIAAEEER
jgi:hypothetical protein